MCGVRSIVHSAYSYSYLHAKSTIKINWPYVIMLYTYDVYARRMLDDAGFVAFWPYCVSELWSFVIGRQGGQVISISHRSQIHLNQPTHSANVRLLMAMYSL
jgi:hypothetical protein